MGNIRGAGSTDFLINEADEIICIGGGYSDGALGETARMFYRMNSLGDSLDLVLSTDSTIISYGAILKNFSNDEYLIRSSIAGIGTVVLVLNTNGEIIDYFPFIGMINKRHWVINSEGDLISHGVFQLRELHPIIIDTIIKQASYCPKNLTEGVLVRC